MNLSLLFGGDPCDWIPANGRPARCVVFNGMPSFESANRRIHLVTQVVMLARAESGWIVAPWDYRTLAEAHPGELIRGRWRPCIYHFAHAPQGWHGISSQHELMWRWVTAGHNADEIDEAGKRAKEVLRDNLSEHQMLEYALTNAFTVVGGASGNTYQIREGNGFALIERSTREELVSYCLHPETWMPHDDVALATKLALECEETEAGTVTRASAYHRPAFARSLFLVLGQYEKAAKIRQRRQRSTRVQRYAADMERELV